MKKLKLHKKELANIFSIPKEQEQIKESQSIDWNELRGKVQEDIRQENGLCCPHYEEAIASGAGYTYDLFSIPLNLCPECNAILSGQIMQQLALETFLSGKESRAQQNN